MESCMKYEVDGNILEASLCCKERILFVDDEDLYVNMVFRMLENHKYQVTAKKNSAEALKLFCLKPGAFDLVITGQTLPGMTGMELAQKLLNVRPDIPVILCTASSNISEEDAKKQGIREFMMKPFETNNLVRTIRKVLDEKVLRQVD